MAALTSLLEGHKSELATEFKISFSALEAKIDLMQTTVSSYGQRITSLETNADAVDGRLLSLEASYAELTATSEKLKVKAADLEARSRRNNARIVGLSESIEGPRPTKFFLHCCPNLWARKYYRRHPCWTKHTGPWARSPSKARGLGPSSSGFTITRLKKRFSEKPARGGPTYNIWENLWPSLRTLPPRCRATGYISRSHGPPLQMRAETRSLLPGEAVHQNSLNKIKVLCSVCVEALLYSYFAILCFRGRLGNFFL